MTAADERYARAQAIVHDALERPAHEREGFLAGACGGDAELRREVDWLITAVDTNTPGAFDFDAEKLTASLLADARIEAQAPREYRLVERLGEGGMGQVWLAERDDGGIRRRVALKMLRGGGLPDQRELTRFVAEGRILATLQHVNIAHLVDAGAGVDGMPFLAMEYVDGERIDRWCDARGLSLRERIGLFLKVCAAVEYAHGQLVIHRDLKPPNILVGANGEPKLLDFGIARLLEREAGPAPATTVLNAMTLAYASPEQIEGRTLGTATDIYSLGVVLYELLAGARPFDHLPSEHARSNAIVSGEVAPPSRRAREAAAKPATGIRRTARRIPADIDAIVLKALRREPEQRYASVGELADDLRRYLAAQPVLARKGQLGYRMRRFLWRNRWPVAAAAVLLAVGATFVFERERQLRRIQIERDRAEAVAHFTGDLFNAAGSLPTRGNEVSVREMLDRGAVDLRKRADLPASIKGALLLAMGSAYNSLNLGEEALPLLIEAQPLLDQAGPAKRAELIAAIGSAHHARGDYPQAIASYTEAIALLRSLPGNHADEIDELRVYVAGLQADMVDVPIAATIRELEGIVAAVERTPGRSSQLLALAYARLAQAYNVADDNVRGRQAAERSAEVSARLYGRDDKRASRARNQLALALMDPDPMRAAALFGEQVADQDRFTGTPSVRRAGLQYNQGKSLRLAGRLGEAEAVLEQALATVQERGGPQHRLTLVVLDELGVVYNLSGHPQRTIERLGEALPDFEEAARKGGDGERDCHAMALAAIGEAERLLGRHDDAAAHFAKAETILAGLDSEGFKDDLLDLLEWSTRLQLDRTDANAARALLRRYDALVSGQSPSQRRVTVSRELHDHLDAISASTAGPAATRLQP